MNKRSEVKIIGISDQKERICAAAARISTQKGDALDVLSKSENSEKNNDLIRKVLKSGHKSIIEHLNFNIAFNNVSVIVEQFMIEFRLASFTVKSRRYVDFSNMGYYIPKTLEGDLKNRYTDHMDFLFQSYQKLLDKGIEKEDARFVLPYCYFSNFYCSINARELCHVLESAINGRGRYFEEIYSVGLNLLNQAKEYCPGMLDDFEIRDSRAGDGDALTEDVIDSSSRPMIENMYQTENALDLIINSFFIEKRKAATASDLDQTEKSKIIDEIIHSDRPRALETASYVFRLNGVSLAAITHFARHRIHSLIIPSLENTDRHNYVIPESLSSNQEAKEIYLNAFNKNIETCEYFRASGFNAFELAYFNLSGNTLDIVSAMNARELLLFFKLRTCNRAQWEIRRYSLEMLKTLRKKEPEIFNYYGPSCFVNGKCPEGKLTCGEITKVKSYFTEL